MVFGISRKKIRLCNEINIVGASIEPSPDTDKKSKGHIDFT